MSKQNLFVPQVKNHVSRNAFDLSHRRIYSSKCGEILPCLVQDCLPGDKFKISCGTFSRTAPLNTAAFVRLKQYYNYYFVPYRLLYRDFPSFVVQQSKSSKAAVDINKDFSVPTTLPYVGEQFLEQICASDFGGHYEHEVTLDKSDTFGLNCVGFNRLTQSRKLLQYLGYYKASSIRSRVYPSSDIALETFKNNNTRLNLFPLLAYQKVYNDFYRFSQWENEQANTYNIDYMAGSSSMVIPIDKLFDVVHNKYKFNSPAANMFDMRYVNFTKDTFLGAVPTSQFGAKATVSTLKDDRIFTRMYLHPNVNQEGSSVVVSSTDGDLGVKVSDDTPTRTSFTLHKNSWANSPVNSEDFLFDILTFRAAQAKQKFLEVTLSNNSDYKSQVEAHFNVNVSSLMSGLCDFIGGFSADLSLNTVQNTNLAQGDATYSASATMQGGGSFDFEAREHGLIIGVTYILPFIDYSAVGYDFAPLRVNFSDFALPEYDRLGYEEVDPRLLLGDLNTFVPTASPSTFIPRTPHLGYGPRYYDYKTNYDVVLGDFNFFQGGTQPQFVASLTPNLTNVTPPNGKSISPSYAADMLCTKGLMSDLAENRVSWRSFKVAPQILNNVFTVQCGLIWKDDTSTPNTVIPVSHDDNSFDQFYTVMDYNITKISNLDRLGLPY